MLPLFAEIPQTLSLTLDFANQPAPSPLEELERSFHCGEGVASTKGVSSVFRVSKDGRMLWNKFLYGIC